MPDKHPLDGLALEAANLGAAAPGGDAPGAAAPEGDQPTPRSPNYGAIGFLLTGFRNLATMLLKVESLQVTLSDPNIEACADALAPVADKYGLSLGDMFDGPEGKAVLVAGPILWTAAQQLMLELKARKAKPVDQAATTETSTDAGAPA